MLWIKRKASEDDLYYLITQLKIFGGRIEEVIKENDDQYFITYRSKDPLIEESKCTSSLSQLPTL